MYLQVCKYRSFLIAASIVGCCQIQYTNACEQVYVYEFKTENKHKCIEFDSTCDCKRFKKGFNLETRNYRSVIGALASALGANVIKRC